MKDERFLKFVFLISGIEKKIQKIRLKTGMSYQLKSVGVLWLIRLLQAEHGMTANELANLCSVNRSLISREISEMARAGFVTNQQIYRGEKYSRLIKITEKGKIVAHRLIEVGNQVQARLSEGIPEEDIATFYRVLETYYKRLQEI